MKASVQTYRLKLVEDRTVNYTVSRVGHQFDAREALKEYLYDTDCENGVVLFMDGMRHPIGIHTFAIGSLNEIHFAIRDVFKAAIVANANSVIVAHNHPNGDVTPSPNDIELTHKIVLIGEILGVKVEDSIITNRGGMIYSFASEDNLREQVT